MDRLLTTEEAAEYLGLPIATIYEQRARRRYPGVLGIRVGRHVRFRVADLEGWIDAQVEGQRAVAS